MTGSRLLGWLTSTGSRWYLVDRTVERFLQHGGDLAVDVLDRIVEVVAYVGKSPGSLDDGSLSTATTGLPEVMLTALVDALGDRLVEVAAQPTPTSRSRAQEESEIRLDVGSGAVVLRLPAVTAELGPALWIIAADGETEEVRAEAQWVGRGATTAAKTALLRRPTRIVNVRLGGLEFADHRLVDPADPLLLFDLDGVLIPPHSAIPRGDVWAVAPEGGDIVSGGGVPLRVLGDMGQPVGWPRWTIRSIDVGQADGIRLTGGKHVGRLRVVKTSGAPRFSLLAPIPALTSQRGLDVLSERPVVLVPDGVNAGQWQLEVIASSGGPRTVHRSSLADCPRRGPGWDPLAAFAAPALGDFFITVRGAFGKKAQCMVSLAEGLAVTVEPALRRPAANGLEPASVHLVADPGMVLSATSVELGADALDSSLTCQVGSVTQRFTIVPPSVLVRLVTADASSGWGASGPTVHPDMLEREASLHVRVPGDASAYRLEFRASQGDERQSIEPSARRGQDNRLFDLTRFVETARRAQAGVFTLTSPSSAFTVATLRPRRLASGAAPAVGGIQLQDFQPVGDVHAALYHCTAPWLPPREVAVLETGLIPLSEELSESGPLLVELAIADPWVPTVWPDWAGRDAISCPLPGHRADGSSGRRALSLALAGHDPDPYVVLDDLAAVWAVLAVEDQLRLPAEVGRRVHRMVLDAVHRDPSVALLSLMRSPRGRASVMQLLIRSQLVERRYPAVAPEELSVGWAASPVLAALAAIPWAVGGAAEEEFTHELRLHGDESLTALCSTGRNGHREVGAFGPEAVMLDRLSAARVNEIWNAAQVVPEGLLHPDSRTAATKQLFDVRHAAPLNSVIKLVEQDLKRAARILKEAAPVSVYAQFDARLGQKLTASWQLLPAASFAWAALARMAAHDLVPSPVPAGRREAWAELAKHAPDYVGMDIVLADALISSADKLDRST